MAQGKAVEPRPNELRALAGVWCHDFRCQHLHDIAALIAGLAAQVTMPRFGRDRTA